MLRVQIVSHHCSTRHVYAGTWIRCGLLDHWSPVILSLAYRFRMTNLSTPLWDDPRRQHYYPCLNCQSYYIYTLKQINMSSPINSRSAQTASKVSLATNTETSTSAQPTQCQSSEDPIANHPTSEGSWSGVTRCYSAVDEERIYNPIPMYQPPLSTKLDQQSTKSSGSHTDQKGAADLAPSLDPDEVPQLSIRELHMLCVLLHLL